MANFRYTGYEKTKWSFGSSGSSGSSKIDSKEDELARKIHREFQGIKDEEDEDKISSVDSDEDQEEPEEISFEDTLDPEEDNRTQYTSSSVRFSDTDKIKLYNKHWKEEYYFSDFIYDYKGENLSGNTLLEMEIKMQSVIRRISTGEESTVLLKEKEKISIYKFSEFKTTYSVDNGYFYRSKRTDEKKTKKDNDIQTVKNWLFTAFEEDKMYEYYGRTCIPYSREDPVHLENIKNPRKRKLNTFGGFLITDDEWKSAPDITKKYLEEKSGLIFNHIKIVLASGNEEYYTYIVDWFASLFQYPDRKLPAVAVVGEEGIGKDIIIEVGIKPMILGNYGLIIGKKYEMEEKDGKNKVSSEKILINYQEMDKTKWNLSDLNRQIFGTERVGRSMFKDGVVEKDFTHYFGSANSTKNFKVDEESRHWAFFEASTIMKHNVEYFNKLVEALKNKTVMSYFLHKLLERKITTNFEVIPETKIRLKIMGKDSVRMFLKWAKKEGYFGEENFKDDWEKSYEAYCEAFSLSPVGDLMLFWKQTKSLVELREVRNRDSRKNNRITLTSWK